MGTSSGTQNAVADVLPRNPVESIIEEKVNCAIIRDLVLSSREQLIEEQRKDPELGHIYRYLENPEDSSVNATICENWSRDFRLIEAVNETTRKTPAELFLGRKLITPFPKLVMVSDGTEFAKEEPKRRISRAPSTSRYNLRSRGGREVESRPAMEMKTQQGGPVRSRKGRGRKDNPYIEERTRSGNRNVRRIGDQQREDQERK
ncbi:uncharacterized protein TNCV_1798421 [Trichonephila clavipes]|uniref:Uncharacterized protein n=1 Tax=Trichonephila clavipes TaxID=2585209 RepID=A0A8X6SJL4_TRICX|nr:uncharacterized protein TNCV_1798421 [Trichonephila clavipes]